jgi:hypothetical protein
LKRYFKANDLRIKEDAKHFPSDSLLIFQNYRARVGNGKPASLFYKYYIIISLLESEKTKVSLVANGHHGVQRGARASTFIKPSILQHARAKPSQNFLEENRSQPH